MREKILVTGGAGYIGSITTKALLDAGYKVVVVDALKTGHEKAVDKRARLYVAEIADKKKLAKIMEDEMIDGVIDFAAFIAVGGSMADPMKYLQNNVFDFIFLMDCIAYSGCRCVIKSSTAAVYGEPADEKAFPLLESYTDRFRPNDSSLLKGEWEGESLSGNDLFDKIIEAYSSFIKKTNHDDLALSQRELNQLKIPTSVYGLTKLLDEIIMKKYDNLSGIKSIALRYFNVAGASPDGEMGEDHPEETHLIPVAINCLLHKSEFTILGNDFATKDGTVIRDFVHVVDLANGHINALKLLLSLKKSDIINLGSNEGYSVLEIIRGIERVTGYSMKYKFGSRREGDPAKLLASTAKAKKVLNWKPKYALEEIISSAWQWHKSHPRGYNRE